MRRYCSAPAIWSARSKTALLKASAVTVEILDPAVQMRLDRLVDQERQTLGQVRDIAADRREQLLLLEHFVQMPRER
jgi:hypothetical protein